MIQNNKKEIGLVGAELRYIKEIISGNSIGIDYAVICALALAVVEEYLEDADAMVFPIDVEAIVKGIGVQVFYQPLNKQKDSDGKTVHKLVGTFFKQQNPLTGKTIACILVDSEASPAEQRYALAHELAHCLIHSDEWMFSSAYRVMPMLFKDMEEIVADIFAIFLLIPIPVFLTEFYEYVKSQNEPVKTSEWLRYLSIIANVPYEDVAIGYQNIRYVFGILYKIKHEKDGMKEFVESIKKVIWPEKQEEIIEMVKTKMKNMVDNLQEDKENMLYL